MAKVKNKKGLICVAIIALVLVIVAIIAVFIYKSNVYRLITVDSMEGTVELNREGNSVEIFRGIHLKSGDMVNTEAESNMLLLADDDKHILAEENTGFSVIATGTEDKGGIAIHLEYGSTLITIDNKLAEESFFEVHTPNAALSVRGTVFRVTYDRIQMCTTVEIIEGVVEIATDTNVVLGNAGETYYIDTQGMIQSGTPTGEEQSGTSAGEEQGTEVGQDIAPLPVEGLLAPLTITQAEFESNYMEEKIELTPENSGEYFEVIEKDGTFYFVLKPGYTPYEDGLTVVTNNGDSASASQGASRYLFQSVNMDSADGWIESWEATGTIAKYSLPDDMWCQIGDMYIILIEMNDGSSYSIQR